MSISVARLRWDCRRGMLELDLLLLPFLEKVFPGLSEEEQALFVKLLSFNDQDLYGWLVGHEQLPADPALAAMIKRVRGSV